MASPELQFIASGRNKDGVRVILWRLGNYQYSLETNGKDEIFEAEYYAALDKLKRVSTEVVVIKSVSTDVVVNRE